MIYAELFVVVFIFMDGMDQNMPATKYRNTRLEYDTIMKVLIYFAILDTNNNVV